MDFDLIYQTYFEDVFLYLRGLSNSAIAIFKQVQKQSLQYSQEYVVGQPGIKGHVDVQKYIDIHQDFDIGANKYGLPVFKNPERALSTFKELYSDAITLIQTEFYLDELTTESCQWYKIYQVQMMQRKAIRSVLIMAETTFPSTP